MTLINQTLELAKPGQISTVRTEIPFQIQLKGKPNKPLYETYHGVFVNIQVRQKFPFPMQFFFRSFLVFSSC